MPFVFISVQRVQTGQTVQTVQTAQPIETRYEMRWTQMLSLFWKSSTSSRWVSEWGGVLNPFGG